MADGMFQEGSSKTKAVTKTGAAAKLTNKLVTDAKEAVSALWKARGYMNMTPSRCGRGWSTPRSWASVISGRKGVTWLPRSSRAGAPSGSRRSRRQLIPRSGGVSVRGRAGMWKI